MYHAVNLGAQFVEQLLDDWGIGAGGREHKLPGIHRRTFYAVSQFVLAAIYQLIGHSVVITLGIVLGQILRKHIMAGRSQTVGAHTTVIAFLISGLPCAGESHNHISRADIRIVDHIAALHAASDRRVDDDGAYQVTHIGGLSTCRIDADTHLAEFCEQFVSTIDNRRDDLTRHQHLVTSDRRRYEDIIHSTHAEQIVSVHHNGILGDTFPYGEVASLLPVHIRQTRLCASTVSVHDIAILGVTSQDVGDDLAERLWEDALVDVLDGVVYVLLGGTYAAHHISVVHILIFLFRAKIPSWQRPAAATSPVRW